MGLHGARVDGSIRCGRLAGSLLLGFGLSACEAPDLPGKPVGTFAIEGDLVENSCGTTALPAVDPLSFTVEIRDQDGVGTWIMTPPGVTGRLSSEGAFRFEYTTRYTAIEPGMSMPTPEEPLDYLRIAPEPPRVQPGCALQITEVIAGRVRRSTAQDGGLKNGPPDDAGLARADLSADNTIEITPTFGSDCSPALISRGGAFSELPCRARYRLRGTRTEDAI